MITGVHLWAILQGAYWAKYSSIMTMCFQASIWTMSKWPLPLHSICYNIYEPSFFFFLNNYSELLKSGKFYQTCRYGWKLNIDFHYSTLWLGAGITQKITLGLGGPWEQQDWHEDANDGIFVDFWAISGPVSVCFSVPKCFKKHVVLKLVSM